MAEVDQSQHVDPIWATDHDPEADNDLEPLYLFRPWTEVDSEVIAWIMVSAFALACWAVLITLPPPKSLGEVAGLVFFLLFTVLTSLCVSYPFILLVRLTLLTPFVILHGLYAIIIAPVLVLPHLHRQQQNTGPRSCALCSKCQTIVEDPLFSGSRWPLVRSHRTYVFHTRKTLQKSAETCHFCNLLLLSLDEQNKSALNSTRYGTFRVGYTGHGDPHPDSQVYIKLWKKTFFLRKPNLQVRLYGKGIATARSVRIRWLTKPPKGPTHRCIVPQSTDSNDVMRWAQNQIRQCQRNHLNCTHGYVNVNTRRFLPKRFLDVQRCNDGVISLASSSSLADGIVEYFAEPLLGRSSRPMLNQRLPESQFIMTDLLPSFLEAILITHRLGIQYLWIDSCCRMVT